VYNCPVALWLPLEFPNSPPIVLVLPTATLKVRVGPNVDPAGRVTGGYIDGWARKAEVSSQGCGKGRVLALVAWGS
jgi:ESCRT-I complex subunit TSG101